ncbi:MAG: S41 family peptidase [Alphaproteobacteria bacterium]|nr:S41 family peptidase [Alphaproteobacteria bacterium]
MSWQILVKKPHSSKNPPRPERGTGVRYPWVRQFALTLIMLLASTSRGSALEDDYQAQQLFRTVLEQVQKNYVSEVEAKPLVETAISAMLASLDPESGYSPPGAPMPEVGTLAGDVPEVGLTLGFEPQTLVVVATADNSPAAKAGFETGDRILAINNSPIQDSSLYQAIANLRQSISADPVTLLVQRNERQFPISVKLAKAPVAPSAAKVSMRLLDFAPSAEPAPKPTNPDGSNDKNSLAVAVTPTTTGAQTAPIAMVRIPRFTESTPTELESALKQASASAASKMAAKASSSNSNNGQFSGLIIDLRQNPGGNFEAAIAASNLFLKSGMISSLMPRNIVKTAGEATATATPATPAQTIDGVLDYSANPAKATPLLAKTLPIVVLLDRGSSGATEIMAAALKDNHRAVLIGNRSAANASFHRTIPLSNGGKLFLTIARWQRPAGQLINDGGVQPDILVSNQPQPLQGVDLSKSTKPTPPTTTKPEPKPTSSETEDAQLLRAIDAIRSMVIYANLNNSKK